MFSRKDGIIVPPEARGLGLIFQSYIALNLKLEEGFGIVNWGLCAWMSIPYWILFFANLHFKRISSAQVITTIAVYAVVIFSNIWLSFPLFSPALTIET